MKKKLTIAKGHYRFDTNAVLYLTGDANYCYVHMLNGEMVLTSRTLKWFEKQWPSFLRVHKHALVNPQHAAQVNRAARLTSPSYLVMRDQTQLLIARRRVSDVVEQLRPLHKVVYAKRRNELVC
ncbi:LytR/AlgR family response regulator transcription factor [Spirosoma gilvum]